jgi:hypothetical protein
MKNQNGRKSSPLKPPSEPEMTPRVRENQILQGPVFKPLQGLRELLSANEYLEGEIQKFPDEKPKVQIKHVQFSTVPIIPRTASWSTTNADID